MREILSPSLAERTSLHLGGRAIAELVLERAEDYPLLAERLQQLGGSPYIIGAGTNLLARDGELPVVLLRSAIKEGPEIVWESEARAHVRAGAGVPLPRLLGFCARRGLGGLEGLVGIPGSVGGAVAMNAGSYGARPAGISWKSRPLSMVARGSSRQRNCSMVTEPCWWTAKKTVFLCSKPHLT